MPQRPYRDMLTACELPPDALPLAIVQAELKENERVYEKGADGKPLTTPRQKGQLYLLAAVVIPALRRFVRDRQKADATAANEARMIKLGERLEAREEQEKADAEELEQIKKDLGLDASEESGKEGDGDGE